MTLSENSQNSLDAFLLSANDDLSLTHYINISKKKRPMEPTTPMEPVFMPDIATLLNMQEMPEATNEWDSSPKLLRIMDEIDEQTHMTHILAEMDREMALDVREEMSTPRGTKKAAKIEDTPLQSAAIDVPLKAGPLEMENSLTLDTQDESFPTASTSLQGEIDAATQDELNHSQSPAPISPAHSSTFDTDSEFSNTPDSPQHQTSSPQHKLKLKLNMSMINGNEQHSQIHSVRSESSSNIHTERSSTLPPQSNLIVNFQSFHAKHQIMNLLLHLTRQKREVRNETPNDTQVQVENIMSGKTVENLPPNLYSNLIQLVDACTTPIKSFWTLRLFSLKIDSQAQRYHYNRTCSYIETFRWCFKHQQYFKFETEDGLPSIQEFRRIKRMMRLTSDSHNYERHFSDILKHELQYLIALDTVYMLQVQIYRHLRDNALPSSIHVNPKYMHVDYSIIEGRSLMIDDDDQDAGDIQSVQSGVSNLPQVPIPKILEPCCRLTELMWNDDGVLFSRPDELHFSLEPHLPPEPAQDWRVLVSARDVNALFYVIVRDVLMTDPETNTLQKDTNFLGFVGFAEEGIEQYFAERGIQQRFTHFVRCAKRSVFVQSVDEPDEAHTLDLIVLLSWLQEPANFSVPQAGTQGSNCIIFAIDSSEYAEESRPEEVEAYYSPQVGTSPLSKPKHFTSQRHIRRFLQKRLDEVKFEQLLSDSNYGLNWKHFAAPDSAWIDKQNFTPRRTESAPLLKRSSPLASTPTNTSANGVPQSSSATPNSPIVQREPSIGSPQHKMSPAVAALISPVGNESPRKARKLTEDTYGALSPRDYATLLARKGESDPTQYEKLYRYFCSQHGCKPNSTIVKQFANGTLCSENGVIDLSLNLVGDKGIRPIIDCAALMARCRSFCARNNHLSNDAITYMCKHFRENPSICHLDLRGNEDLGLFCGQELLHFVRDCDWIQDVELERTSIPLRIIGEIGEMLELRFKASQ